MKTSILHLAFAFLLCACGSSSSSAPPCAGVEVHGTEKWSAPSGQPAHCQDLADEYQAKLELAPGLELDAKECTATFYAESPSASVDAECDVSPDGGADCKVRVFANGNECELALQVTP